MAYLRSAGRLELRHACQQGAARGPTDLQNDVASGRYRSTYGLLQAAVEALVPHLAEHTHGPL